MSGILQSMDVSSKGMTVQRRKMNVVSENIANAETTKTTEGGPYRRKRVTVTEDKVRGSFQSALKQAHAPLARTNARHLPSQPTSLGNETWLSTAEPEEIEDPASSFRLVYDPTHPDADEEGFVKMPDVEIITEMVDMMIASRAYEANAAAIASAKKMAKDALDISTT